MSFQRVTQLLSRRVLKLSSVSVRHHNFDGEAPSKTHMSLIAREDESHTYIITYSNYGLRFSSGLGVLGPCALFPRAILHWNVFSAENITPESLSLFCMLEPKLDILIIGKGDWDAKVDYKIVKYLRSKNINVEILPTEQACSTFNFLNSERRVVAAAIIPPTNIPDEFDNESMSVLKLDDIDETERSNIDAALKSIKGQTLTSLIRNRHQISGESHQSDQEDNNTKTKDGSKK